MLDDFNSHNEPIKCNGCGRSFPVSILSQEDYDLLRAVHLYSALKEEQRMLLKVKRLYKNYPEIAGLAEKNVFRMTWQKNEPSYVEPFLDKVDEEGREALEYIKNSAFNVEKRLDWVEESLTEHSFILTAKPICCPDCGKGKLEIDSETYVSPYLD